MTLETAGILMKKDQGLTAAPYVVWLAVDLLGKELFLAEQTKFVSIHLFTHKHPAVS